jgi:branched-chain amino acid aminotransferase
MHRFMLHNGHILENSGRVLAPGQVGLLNGWGVFSTIRVFDGVLFAFERHWARMSRDAQLLRVPFPVDAGELERNLLRLVEANNAWNSTLRVVIVRNRGGLWESDGLDRDFDVIAFTTGVKDWGRTVRLGMISDARHAASRFAGTKMLSWSFNLVWYEAAQSKGYNEVVLLNERGEVSECTSANIFASAGDEVFTPPLSSGCLPGITREILIQETHPDGLQVVEKTLHPSDLEAADEVFITSTTRALLPVDFIEGLKVKAADRARPKLQAAFERYVNAYVTRHKPAAAPR